MEKLSQPNGFMTCLPQPALKMESSGIEILHDVFFFPHHCLQKSESRVFIVPSAHLTIMKTISKLLEEHRDAWKVSDSEEICDGVISSNE